MRIFGDGEKEEEYGSINQDNIQFGTMIMGLIFLMVNLDNKHMDCILCGYKDKNKMKKFLPYCIP